MLSAGSDEYTPLAEIMGCVMSRSLNHFAPKLSDGGVRFVPVLSVEIAIRDARDAAAKFDELSNRTKTASSKRAL